MFQVGDIVQLSGWDPPEDNLGVVTKVTSSNATWVHWEYSLVDGPIEYGPEYLSINNGAYLYLVSTPVAWEDLLTQRD